MPSRTSGTPQNLRTVSSAIAVRMSVDENWPFTQAFLVFALESSAIVENVISRARQGFLSSGGEGFREGFHRRRLIVLYIEHPVETSDPQHFEHHRRRAQ